MQNKHKFFLKAIGRLERRVTEFSIPPAGHSTSAHEDENIARGNRDRAFLR
jgi:hypothetical protein